MIGYEAWTRLAIAILVVGAPLVFFWFLRDAVRIVRGLGGGASGPPSPVARRGADEELGGAEPPREHGDAGTNGPSGGIT